MEKSYNVSLLEESFTVEIPFADHIIMMDVIDSALRNYDSALSETKEFVEDIPEYVKAGHMTQEVADILRQNKESQIIDLQKRIDVAMKYIDSVANI